MKLLGLELSRSKLPQKSFQSGFQSVSTWRSLMGYISEAFAGAWQRNIVVDNSPTTLLAFSAVYACVTGIAADIAKMRIKLTQFTPDEIWEEVTALHGNSKFLWVLDLLNRPNHYQNYFQFTMGWILSKLLYGNTYVLIQRDSSRNVTALYILHPRCVTPLVTPIGDVYYSLSADPLSEIEEGVVVPASEMMHDRMPELWHPLIGVSPLYACAMSVTMGNKIQANSTQFFANSSRPGGIVTVPGAITDEIAASMKANWELNYQGQNSGRVAILSDGMKFEPVREAAEQSQLIDQLKWTVSDVARAFHYPEFKLGGPLPPYAGNVGALITSYYTDCLQSLVVSMESCLDHGLGLPDDMATELDTDALLRMDAGAIYSTNKEGVSAGVLTPNEARKRLNYGPVKGGDSPYLQQQNYSLEALAKRDAAEDPFASRRIPTPAEDPALPAGTAPNPPAATPAPPTPAPPAPSKEFNIEFDSIIDGIEIELEEVFQNV